MNTPAGYQFRSSHGYEQGKWSEWHTCSTARAEQMRYRDGFETRAVFLENETEQARGMQQLNNLLVGRMRENRVRLQACMEAIRLGNTEVALSILRSITST